MKSDMYLCVSFFKNKGTVLLSIKQLNLLFDQYIATHTHRAISDFSSNDSLRTAMSPTNMKMFTANICFWENKKFYIYSLT